MEILQVPYFAYEVDAWDSERERVPLEISTNFADSIKRLENGENLYSVVPEFTSDKLLSFKPKYFQFEEREEIDFAGQKFISVKGPEERGKLLIPYHQIITRDELASLSEWHNGNTRFYKGLLKTFPEAMQFYDEDIFSYVPFDASKMLILSEEQLRAD